MDRRPPSGLNDYWEIFLRRWHLMLIPLFGSVFLTLVSTAFMSKHYQSETVILIDPQKIGTDVVRANSGADAAERLQTISQQVLSRTQLQKLIEQFGLYKADIGKKTQEDIIEMMHKDINLEVVKDDRRIKSDDVTAFKISYEGESPTQAQLVTRQLGSLFIEENLKLREATAEGTSQFVDAELDKVRTTLQEQEDKIKEFKSRYMGSLPEQQQANLAIIGQLQAMLQANSDALNRAEQNKAYLDSMVESVGKKPDASPSSLEIERLRNELTAVEQKYKSTHPDVIRLRNELAALEAQEKAKTDAGGPEGPKVGGQMAAIQQEIKDRTRRQTELEAKIRSIQGRMENLPLIEQQFAELNRDHEITKANYQTLLQKKGNSSMAVSMERSAKGEQLRVLDPASLPERPSKPNMLQLNFMGLFVGVALGGGLAFLQEIKDRSMHNDRDIAHYLPLHVLGCLPEIATNESVAAARSKKIRNWAISSTSLAAAAAVIVFLVSRGKIDFKAWF